MIDNISVRKKEKEKNVKAIPGEEVIMQHCLIVMGILNKRAFCERKVKTNRIQKYGDCKKNVQKALTDKVRKLLSEDFE